MHSFTIRKPFDAHLHGRDADMLNAVVPMTARQCWGAIFEPNLVPPITTAETGKSYLERIRAAAGCKEFKPYLLCYLTDSLDSVALLDALSDGVFVGAKFYPRGATTNSDSGITDVSSLYTPGTTPYECLRALARGESVLQLHGELNMSHDGEELDPYDKEAAFFREVLPRIIDAHPDLSISCEHITSTEAVAFMEANGNERLGCSITAHHLLLDRRDMFRGGLRPLLFCLPVIKREEARQALLRLVASNHFFVWAGTDSAPHDRRKKECDCCSGGIFSAHAAVELYAEALYWYHADRETFEAFMSVNGPVFYGLPPATETITLEKRDWRVEDLLRYSGDPEDVIVPFGYSANEHERHVFRWRMKNID